MARDVLQCRQTSLDRPHGCRELIRAMPRLSRHLSVVLLLGSLPAAGEAAHERRIKATLSTWAKDDVECDYLYTHSSNGGPEIAEQYSMSDGWSLLAIGGGPPGSEEARTYHSQAGRESRARRSVPGFKLSEHIDPESATVESENDETFTIAYSPRSRNSEEDVLLQKMNVKMRGQLTVASADLQPRTMRIELAEPVAVAVPPVRVSNYSESRSIVVDPTTGVLLVRSVDLESSGRAFLFKRVSSSFTHRFDYRGCRFVRKD